MKRLNFVVIFLFFVSILWGISYIIVIPNYKNIVLKKNNININTVISNINTDLENIKKIINDYSKWDDTYDFINNKSPSYIYVNFREGTSTLDDLNIDMIVYTDKQNNIIYNKYNSNITVLDKKAFQKNIIKQINIYENFYSLELIDDKLMFLVKLEIKKSDESGDSNGYMYAIRIIDEEYINNISKVFEKNKMQFFMSVENYDESLENKYIKNLKFNVDFEEDKIVSNIGFYSNDKFLFNLKTINTSEVLNDGLNITYYYNFVISILLFLFIYSFYKKQNDLQNYNEKLELEVQKRTKKLDSSIRVIEEKNKKLYRLSTIDSLTNIKK